MLKLVKQFGAKNIDRKFFWFAHVDLLRSGIFVISSHREAQSNFRMWNGTSFRYIVYDRYMNHIFTHVELLKVSCKVFLTIQKMSQNCKTIYNESL